MARLWLVEPNAPLAHDKTLPPPLQSLEEQWISAGQKALGFEPIERGKKRPSPIRIEMRRDLVEEQERHDAGAQPNEARMGKDEPDKERLLLAG